jgi:hypothetical protein
MPPKKKQVPWSKLFLLQNMPFILSDNCHIFFWGVAISGTGDWI